MPSNVPGKVDWLSSEITALKARMNGKGNAAQELKLDILTSIMEDYRKSLERAREKQVRSAEDGS